MRGAAPPQRLISDRFENRLCRDSNLYLVSELNLYSQIVVGLSILIYPGSKSNANA